MLSKLSFKMLKKLGFWDTVIVTSKLNWCSNGVAGNFTKPKSPYFRAFSGFLTDIAVLQKRVSDAIKKKSQTQSMSDVISMKLGNNYITNFLRKDLSRNELERYGSSLLLYYNEEDYLIEENFRRVTITDTPFDVVSYPQYLVTALVQGDVDPKEYIHAKLHRLNDYLIYQKK